MTFKHLCKLDLLFLATHTKHKRQLFKLSKNHNCFFFRFRGNSRFDLFRTHRKILCAFSFPPFDNCFWINVKSCWCFSYTLYWGISLRIASVALAFACNIFPIAIPSLLLYLQILYHNHSGLNSLLIIITSIIDFWILEYI